MDWGTKRGQFLKRMQRAVNRLSQKERQILVMLYMQNEEMYDYEVLFKNWPLLVPQSIRFNAASSVEE